MFDVFACLQRSRGARTESDPFSTSPAWRTEGVSPWNTIFQDTFNIRQRTPGTDLHLLLTYYVAIFCYEFHGQSHVHIRNSGFGLFWFIVNCFCDCMSCTFARIIFRLLRLCTERERILGRSSRVLMRMIDSNIYEFYRKCEPNLKIYILASSYDCTSYVSLNFHIL